MKRVLIISPHFAPVNAPDGHRVRISLPYYREGGWQAEVLAVKPEHRPDWKDDSLLQTLPDDIPIHRCGAIPLQWSRLVGMGTLGWRSLPFLFIKGYRLLRKGNFDLVYFSTTQFAVLLLGPLWKWLLKVPYVVDIQDPWRNDYYDRPGAPPPPGGWKYRIARFGAKRMEPWCFHHASGFIVVSEDYQSSLRKRYPWFSSKPCAVIPFGVPLRDFALISRESKTSDSPTKICASIGALNPAFQTALNVFFHGIKLSTDLHPEQAGRWLFHFTGTSYKGPEAKNRLLAMEAAQKEGLALSTEEKSSRVSYLDSLRQMSSADLLLVLGSDDLSYAPSRLHTVCAAGRPVLVIAAEGSQLALKASALPGLTLVLYPAGGPGNSETWRLFENRETFFPDLCASQTPPVLPSNLSTLQLALRECEIFNGAEL